MPTSFTTFGPGDTIDDTYVEQFIAPVNNLETGASWYAAASGSTNAYEVTLTPAPVAYTPGMIVHFKANAANTGPATLDVNGMGPKRLQNLRGGELASGQMVAVLYQSNDFRVIGISGGAYDLDGLSDVTLTSPAQDDVLQHNGSEFVNRGFSAAGIAAAGPNNDITQLTGLTTALDEDLGGTGQAGGFTKGDLLAASGASTLASFGVGSDGEFLMSDSGETSGLIWGTPPAVTPVTGSATAGQLTYWSGSSSLKGNSSLTVDADAVLIAGGTKAITGLPPNAAGTGWRISLGELRALGNQTYSLDLRCDVGGLNLYGEDPPAGDAGPILIDSNAGIGFLPDFNRIQTPEALHLRAQDSMVLLWDALAYGSLIVSPISFGWKVALGPERALGNQESSVDLKLDADSWFCLYSSTNPASNASSSAIDSNASIGISPTSRKIATPGYLIFEPRSSMATVEGGLDYSNNPITSSGTGWKFGFQSARGVGCQANSVDLRVNSAWLCLFGGPDPAGNTYSGPDTNSGLGFYIGAAPVVVTYRPLTLASSDSMIVLKDALSYASAPTGVSTSNGWKLGLGPDQAFGNQLSGLDIKLGAEGWFSLYEATNPAGDADASNPDSNAAISFFAGSVPRVRVEDGGRIELHNYGLLRFFEDVTNGANYTNLRAPLSLASDLVFTLPPSAGFSGAAMSTDGSGALTLGGLGAGWSYSGSTITLANSSSTVGVGLASPAGKLHVQTASAGGSVSADADELVVEGSANSGITIKSGASADGALYFGDSGATAQGALRYDHTNDDLFLSANGADVARLDGSSGDLHALANTFFEGIASYATPGAPLYAYTSGSVGEVHHQSSSRRLKRNIEDFEMVSGTLSSLRPVRFDSDRARNNSGLIAEEVKKSAPDLVYELGQEALGVHYDRLPIYILAAWQEQQRLLARARRQIDQIRRALRAA